MNKEDETYQWSESERRYLKKTTFFESNPNFFAQINHV
jgi:hypothetical protein